MRAQAAILAAALLLTPGCFARRIIPGAGPKHVDDWCATYMQGRAYVDAFVIHDLEVTDGELHDRYVSAKTSLDLVDRANVLSCAQHGSGSDVKDADIDADMAEGTRALGKLIELHQHILGTPPVVARSRGIRAPAMNAAPVWVDGLLSDLRKTEAQAVASTAKRR